MDLNILNELIKTYEGIFDEYYSAYIKYAEGEITLDDYCDFFNIDEVDEEDLLNFATIYVKTKRTFTHDLLCYKAEMLLSNKLIGFNIEPYLKEVKATNE